MGDVIMHCFAHEDIWSRDVARHGLGKLRHPNTNIPPPQTKNPGYAPDLEMPA